MDTALGPKSGEPPFNVEEYRSAQPQGWRSRRCDRLRGDEEHSLDGMEEHEPELVVSVGSVTHVYPDNITDRQSTTPGPCFDVDAKIPGKMSGSPILVGSGILTKGVLSRSWQGANLASGGLIAPVLGF
jgi:hypothetical protein